MNAKLLDDIAVYLRRSDRSTRDEIRVEEFVLLALLSRRGLTIRTASFRLLPGERDRLRLVRYLVAPGLAPGLATAALEGDIIILTPDWSRIAAYFNKSLDEFAEILEKRAHPLVERNWPTIAYLLSRDIQPGGRSEPA